jgi:prepilin-type N-terminal cleavage/methylation domain-containing protein
MFVEQMNKRGVTLIELAVVFVIIAIMAGLLVPNIGAWLPNYRLRSATRDIVSTMRTAQTKAVSNNIQYRVNLDDAEIGANGYVLQYQTIEGKWVNDGAVQSLPTGISIIADTLPGKRAHFNPNSTSSGGSVTLGNTKGATRSITLTTATGRVNIN